jgi:hypothetical protein
MTGLPSLSHPQQLLTGFFLFVQVVPFVWYMAFATFPAGILGSFPYKSIHTYLLRNQYFIFNPLHQLNIAPTFSSHIEGGKKSFRIYSD